MARRFSNDFWQISLIIGSEVCACIIPARQQSKLTGAQCWVVLPEARHRRSAAVVGDLVENIC